MHFHSTVVLVIALVASVLGKCYRPSPAFPVPQWSDLASSLRPTLDELESTLHEVVNQDKYENSSYSIEITSADRTIWGAYHTAPIRDSKRPGTQKVDTHSQYRIASITKVLTTLGILYQHNAGNLSLDAPVSQYLPELRSPAYELPWKDITLRIMASQLSGIPREFAQSDLLNGAMDPTVLGLPPLSEYKVPNCDEYNEYIPCNASQLMKQLKLAQPLFAPNQKSTYSNVNFVLLGQVIEHVTGSSYEKYISRSILDPLNMTFSSFDKPSDEHAVLPLLPPDANFTPDGKNYWDVDEGVQNPTGGLYSSAGDMSKLLRYILTHFNAITTGMNWLLPASWSTSTNSFYALGMPFEIFRTDKILPSSRPVTFVTKSGGLPGYYSRILVLEEYGLGLTVLVGGHSDLLTEIVELVTVEVVRAAEAAIWEQVDRTRSGDYVATTNSLNSSVKLSTSAMKGLHLSSFISNSTDVLSALFAELLDSSQPWYSPLMPTLLYEDEENQAGEIWRVIPSHEKVAEDSGRIWDDQCVTDVDQLSYGGKPINKIIFWLEEGLIELPAWNVTMRRIERQHFGGGLVVQQ